MSNSKRNTFVLAGVIVIAVGYFLVNKESAPEVEGSVADEIETAELIEPTGVERELFAESAQEAREAVSMPESQQRSRPLGDAATRSIQQRLNEQQPLPHDVPLDRYKASLWAEIQANPPKIPNLGDPDVDAEIAYQTYMYYGNCSMAPRTTANLDYRLNQITNHANSEDERHLRRMERAAEQTFDFYELCQAIPLEVDARLEAVNWMAEAVRLGHEIAEVQYYEKAMGFLLRRDRWDRSPPIVMLYSGLLPEFKSTARYALNRALEKGHPEAYLAMSKAYLDGVIFPIDKVLAMAYVRVAEYQAMENANIDARIARQKEHITPQLSVDQLAEADELASRLRLGENV